jgi:folate-binding protein YgfZ
MALEPIGDGNRIDRMAVQARPDIEHGYKILREDAGVVQRDRSFVEVKGPDAVDFLQGQVTNDIEALEPGSGCYALLLNPKGRILADMRILMRGPEELWLDGELTAMETVAAGLKTYKIGRRVEISQASKVDRDIVSVIGPKAAKLVGVLPPTEEHAFIECELNDVQLLAVTTDRGMDLVFDTRHVALIDDAMRHLDPVAEDVAEILRIESGRPRLGVDMSDANLPGELGLEERAVSFTKGCYVGQEPVARMYHRGHPNRLLRGLELSGPTVGGTAVAHDGKEVGSVGSACVSPALGPIALSVIRHEVEPGAQVLVGEAAAKVVALPFSID